ncbi:phenylalanine--tRNA ligase subunit beta [Companilactobacillus metriopterae]|uniref:phenylalanine--tRNA ligase subunit beta n=1 Tax=Companilactobacillus metriopterae TaxID=1909267 RepID=UPI00100BBACB|nr:phenylalanine--tRNA ligase subunit beta [Companilactobacillus metriopterae]
MKISRNWLNEYIQLNQSTADIANKISLTGIESMPVYIGKDLSNLVVGHITKIEDHPDSDHMHICQVDVGEKEIQIVCGAPNVALDQYVIVALDGATLPDGVKIKKGKLRGEESNGMICGLDELGVKVKNVPEEFHNGIYVFDEAQKPGESVLDLLGLSDEMVDLDITPNRGDTLGMRGAAWEIGATYDEKPNFVDPKLSGSPKNIDLDIDVQSDKVNGYQAVVLEDVKVGKSPLWMQRRLWNQDIQPTNAVLDIANYVMIEYGQPIQAYDYDKIAGLKLQNAETQEVIMSDGTEVKLSSEDIVVMSGEDVLSIAGVLDTDFAKVTEDTKNVLFESAVFDGATVRKEAQRHDLRNNSSNRFEKGIDTSLNGLALDRIVELSEDILNPSDYSQHIVGKEYNYSPTTISATVTRINSLIGIELTTDEIINIFDRLGFATIVDGENLKVTVPARRNDMSIEADLVEEVIRIYGYENLVGTLPTGKQTKGGYTDKREFSNRLRYSLLSQGMDEAVNFSLLSKKEVEDFNVNETKLVHLLHPMTEDHEYLRTSLIPSLVKNVAYNQARKEFNVRLFDQERIFEKGHSDRPNEIEYISGAISGNIVDKSWNQKEQKVDFYYVKGIVEEMISYANLDANIEFEATSDIENLHPGQTAKITANGKMIGFVGKLHPQYQDEMNVNDTYVFELNVDQLFAFGSKVIQSQPAPKYPSISRDLALLVKKDILSGDIIKDIFNNGGKYLEDVEIFDVYQGDNIERGYKSLGYHLVFLNRSDTLTDEEVEQSFDQIKDSLVTKFAVEIR